MKFHFGGDRPDQEDDGVELPDRDTALREAAQTALRMASESLHQVGELSLHVHSEEGLIGKVIVSLSIERG
jgi:hypothetical protein